MVAFPLSKELNAESQRDLCTLTFIAALFPADGMGCRNSPHAQRWMMEKQNAARADTGILPNLKKEGNCATYSIMDEPPGH